MVSSAWRVAYWALLLFLSQVSAYVPALPTNNTQVAIEGGLNVTDISQLHLRWFPNGAYSQNVSYQLAGSGSTGVSRGAFVHFSEAYANETTPPSSTPWIAMISCDFNATDASQDVDIFTLARDKGAVAAVLYSLYSQACVINAEYADPETFDQVFDIFSTQSLTSVQLIEYQFGQFGPANNTIYKNYNSQRLNQSAAIINASISTGTPPAPGYLYGILQAYNATESVDDPTNNNNNPTMDSPQSKSPKTALAMIILYAITGFVSALFCAIIISGAIRAVRNPERYGPRRHGRGGGQSRARGLTRAILDTFPVVKFGDNTAPQPPPSESKDVESSAREQPLEEWELIAREIARQESPNSLKREGQVRDPSVRSAPSPDIQELPHTGSSHTSLPNIHSGGSAPVDRGEGSSRTSPLTEVPPAMNKEIMPDAMGRETCPICITDFEEGDDLRVLPCQGQHRFHQTCVDPWLLELSSSCPICRQDFLALENMLSGEPSEYSHDDHEHHEHEEEEVHPVEAVHHTRPGPSPHHGNRFSRYLRFATHRNNSTRRRHDSDGHPVPRLPPASTSQSTLERNPQS